MNTATAKALGLAVLLALGSTGCIKEMVLNGQIEATRTAADAIDTLSDYEAASVIAWNGIGQFEGMHYLAPDNEDALFMLVKSWTSATYAFIEDQMEQAEDAEGSESPLTQYHKARARAGYERAIHYGVELLEHKHRGFEQAKKNDATMKAWLAAFDDAARDAPNLFWTGYAWVARVNVLQEDPEMVANLFVGVALIERANQLDDKFFYGNAHTILGAYHARSAMAELDEAKKEFDKALAITQGKMLLPKVQLAAKYYCTKGDRDAYVKALTEVVEAGDTLPEQRLANVIAKRRAKRYLGKERLKACGF
jgi:tetratricopeptide (TPR) repeat protein